MPPSAPVSATNSSVSPPADSSGGTASNFRELGCLPIPLARRIAAAILKLTLWPSARRHTSGLSCCLGLSVESASLRPVLSPATRANERAVTVLLQALKEAGFIPSNFRFTSVQVNVDAMLDEHVDKHNEGLSLVLAVSDTAFDGGQLEIRCNGAWVAFNIQNRPLIFDGNAEHRTVPFTNGRRFSLVLFHHSSFSEAPPMLQRTLVELGFWALPSLAPRLREWLFLSHFDGADKFGLADAVKLEAAKVGRKMDIIKRDRLQDGSDMLLAEPYNSDFKLARDGRLCGYHSAYPCGTYSRIRFTGRYAYPKPVRDRTHMLGLPNNTPEQQAEADKGTLAAVRSATLCKTLHESGKSLGVPCTATVENPADPGVAPFPSSFLLPELRAIENDPDSEEATTALCAHGSIRGLLFRKQLTFKGWLKGLSSLAAACTCAPSVKHTTVNTWDNARTSAAYPVALCERYAKLVIQHLFADTDGVVRTFAGSPKPSLSLAPLAPERPALNEAGALSLAPSAPETPAMDEAISLSLAPLEDTPKNSLVRVGKWNNCLTRAPKRPADFRSVSLVDLKAGKRARKDAEEVQYIGGMRCPLSSLAMVPAWESVGARIAVIMNGVLDSTPDAQEVILRFGDLDYSGPSAATLEKVRSLLISEFKIPGIIQKKPEFGNPSEINATLFCGLLRAAGDPDTTHLENWTLHGAPMGIDMEIPTAGIFPPSTKGKPAPSVAPELAAQWYEIFHHYQSVLDNAEDAHKEFERFLGRGFAVRLDQGRVLLRFPEGHLNKVGLIVKVRRDGTRKVRIIIDMRRSLANERARIPERPILPRPLDPARDAVRPLAQGLPVELASADFSDAFCHIFLHPSELRNNLVAVPPVPDATRQQQNSLSLAPCNSLSLAPRSRRTNTDANAQESTRVTHGPQGQRCGSQPSVMHTHNALADAPTMHTHNALADVPTRSLRGQTAPEIALMVRLGFGSNGGPLIWSRYAAALGRLGQSILRPKELPGRDGRLLTIRSLLRIYLDDPIFVLIGPAPARRRELAAVLIVWAACGFSLAWQKGARGNFLNWIGVDYSIDLEAGTITLAVPEAAVREAVDLANTLLQRPMGSLRILRRLAGKGSWIFSISPRARWVIQRLWGTIADATTRAASSTTPTTPGARQRRGMFARRQVEQALKWVVAYWGRPDPPLRRTLGRPVKEANLEIVVDASPWGLGGYLEATTQGVVLEFFESKITPADVARFKVDIGDCRGQQYWEALAILVSLRIWGKHFRAGRARLHVRGDSVVALTLASKLASSAPLLNALGAEISLELEILEVEEVFTAHTPGKLLTIADFLSRMHAPGGSSELPSELSSSKRRTPADRCEAFYRVWSISADPSPSTKSI